MDRQLVLEAFINVVIEKLVSWSGQYVLDWVRSKGINDDPMKKWSETLRTLRAVLEDAEQKQFTSEEVKLWLDDLHDLAYDVEDLVDDLEIEAQSEMTIRARTSGNKFAKVTTSAASLFNHKLKPDDEMKTKIEDISGKLKDIFERKRNLGLNSNVVVGERVVPLSRQTTSLPPTRVFGREKEKKEIVEMLMKPEPDSPQVPVITILGMGGMGKTTLAQDIYHDENVVKCFDLKAWVCVSDVFDIVGITRAILKQIPGTDDTEKLDFNQLQEKLKQMLSGKRFLLVLDDIWNEDYGEWDVLRRPFHYRAAGSRILTTTRNKRVASTMSRTNEPYVLGVLGEDDGLSLLALHALGREDFHDHRDLKESGEQIVKKCGRLPLAIKTIAGLLLHIPQERKQWEDVLNNKKWAEESDGILPALRLSYYHLPYHLKQCFAYCSIIPKDYIFNRNALVLLWMAEGLLQQPAGGSKQIEDFGHDCFQELLSRSFLQLTSGSTTKFIMHDLINDLAVHVAGERCFRIDDISNENWEYKISNRTRHLSFISQDYEVSKKFDVFNIAHRLRTFLPLPPRKSSTYDTSYISGAVLALKLSRLGSLRVLNLWGYHIVELPKVVGALKHLRYLNLSYTKIEQLPQFVCSLYNLQMLSLNSCSDLRELPSSINCLMNLRHLDLENTPHLRKMPSGIGKLTSLQTLSKVIVGRDTGSCNLKDLKDLRHLHGTLSIEELVNVTDDAVATDLRSKEHLEILKLRWPLWDVNVDLSRDRLLEKRVLENLQPHCNLKVLEIEGYGGVGFPSWVGGQSMLNVVKIHLQGCSEIEHLPPLGELPLLKHLDIESLGSIITMGAEFYGGRAEEIAFPSLETLSFHKMTKWKEWSPPVAGKGLFPHLHDLKIDDCRELGSIPILDLPCLCNLKLRQCSAFLLERLVNLTSLRKMDIYDVAGLTCLPEQFVNSLVSLEEADFWSFDLLGSLWQDNGTSSENPFNRLNMSCFSGCYIFFYAEGEQRLHLCYPAKEIRYNRYSVRSSRDRLLENMVLENLQPHCNLKELEIHGYDGLGFPSWVGGQTMSNMVKICLHGCSKITHLPVLGELPLLRYLDIEGLNGITSVGTEFYGNCAEEILYFPSLETLIFSKMTKWKEWSPPVDGKGLFPRLRHLKIDDCRELGSIPTLDLPFLGSLKLRRCKEVWLEMLINLTSLKTMVIEDVAGLTCLPEKFVNSLVSLEEAAFMSCDQLGSLWRNNGTSLEDLLNRLNRLHVSKCDNLISLLEEGELGLPNGLHGLASLQRISIRKCPSLVWDGTDRLPKSLKTLELNCPKLDQLSKIFSSISLDDGNQYHSIASEETINHEGCTDGFLISSSSYFASLVELTIAKCPGLESFSVTCFPTLRSLYIEDCADLKSLPDGIHGLASLEDLSIYDCGNLWPIGDKDLPPSLIELTIVNVGGERKKEKSVVLSDWGFHTLTSLQSLDIAGFEDVVSFEQVVVRDSNSTSTSTSYLFPPSLTQLSITSFPNLKSLSNSLQNLTSLRDLYIINCPKLESLAGADNDEASLQIISSLHELFIYKCSEVLRKRCKKGEGKYWPTVQHIPLLKIRDI